METLIDMKFQPTHRPGGKSHQNNLQIFKRHKPIRKKESWSGDNSNTILKAGEEMGE